MTFSGILEIQTAFYHQIPRHPTLHHDTLYKVHRPRTMNIFSYRTSTIALFYLKITQNLAIIIWLFYTNSALSSTMNRRRFSATTTEDRHLILYLPVSLIVLQQQKSHPMNEAFLIHTLMQAYYIQNIFSEVNQCRCG